MALFCAFLAFLPLSARAVAIELQNPLKSGDVIELIHSIINWLTMIGAPIAVIMIIWGAFKIMFAQGDPKNFATGMKTILWAVVGYGIIFIGWGIIGIIQGILE